MIWVLRKNVETMKIFSKQILLGIKACLIKPEKSFQIWVKVCKDGTLQILS